MADTKRAASHKRPGPERGVAAYRRTLEREQTILIGRPYDIGGRQRQHSDTNTHTIFKFPDRLVAGSDSALSSSTAAVLQFTRNPAIVVAADCIAAPRRNFKADSAAPWQRAPPLDHVQVAAVRAAWHES